MGPAAGVYGQNGEQGGKGDYYSADGLHQLYWVFYAGKPVNRRRRSRGRRRLSSPNGAVAASGFGEWEDHEDFGERVQYLDPVG